MYQMIYQISINMYQYEYRLEKADRYPALMVTHPVIGGYLLLVQSEII